MCQRIIPVGLQRPALPYNRTSVVAEKQFGKASIVHPAIGEDIAGREPKRLQDVSLGLRAAPHKSHPDTDESMGVSEVSIERQAPLARPNALSRPLRYDLHG